MALSFAISTHWNASRHTDGAAMVDEILDLGFDRIEAGYDLRLELATGVRQRVNEGAVRVTSVHNFCPVPASVLRGHPELFLLADPRDRDRRSAVHYTTDTIRFAGEIGASVVVAHAGRIQMRPRTRKLMDLSEDGRQFSARYEKLHTKLLLRRDKQVQPHLENLYRSLDELLPVLEQNGVCLGLENLPSWETVPTEQEMLEILRRYDSPHIGFWFDIGHGQIRQTLGFSSPIHWLRQFGKRVAGMHVHDVAPPVTDHVMPPHGSINFAPFKPLIRSDMLLVLEPAPGTPPEYVIEGRQTLMDAWDTGDGEAPDPTAESAI